MVGDYKQCSYFSPSCKRAGARHPHQNVMAGTGIGAQLAAAEVRQFSTGTVGGDAISVRQLWERNTSTVVLVVRRPA